MDVNLVIVFNKNRDKVLMCQRRKDPYKGKLNFVGGKVQKGESSECAAYRELFEETGISSKDIVLHHLVDSIYFIHGLTLEVYFGYLEKDFEVYFDVVKDYNAALEARPEINSAKTSFNPNFPQYMLDIDAAACKKAGISPSDILSTMQGYFGGLYASNFNSFGKMYRVMVQAEPEATKNLESLSSIKVRNGDEMAPITQFVSIKKVYGPDIISRFNLYTSMKVMVAPASGYTSGQALAAIAEVAKENLPAGFAYELGGMAREEAETSGSTTGLIFVLCFVFVYLLLSAQYESYIL